MSPPAHSYSSHRIYVGGIDPDRLSVTQVLERLEKELAEKSWIFEKVHEGSCYFQFQAKHTGKKSPENSPLDLTKKLFHNVKWKGCKLMVEPAKPHFLERLQQERQAMAISNTKNNPSPEEQSEQVPESADEAPNTANQPKRFYKIRRGFGETVWRVDTKPYQVESFSGFRKLQSKLARQKRDLELQQKKQRSPKGKKQKISTASKANTRAIHMRFDEPSTSTEVARSYSDRIETAPKQDDEASIVSAGSSSSESDESSNGTQENKNDASKKTYQWSDEGGDTSNSSDESDVEEEPHERHEDTSNRSTDYTVIPETSLVKEDSSYSSEERNEESEQLIEQDEVPFNREEMSNSNNSAKADSRPLQNGAKPVEDILEPSPTDNEPTIDPVSKEEPSGVNLCDNGQNEPKKYVWSDDESSSCDDADDHEHEVKIQHYEMKEKWNPMDEFAMGDNDEDEGDASNDAKSSIEEDERTKSADNDLEDEANANKSILAQLFPELASSELNTESNSVSKSQDKPGWAPPRQMLRFDPTQISAQKYILENEEPLETESDAGESESDSNEVEGQEDNEAKETMNQEQNVAENSSKGEAVYRQDALETVFKEAREAESEVVVLETEEVAAQTGFSFSFSVSDTPKKSQTEASLNTTDGFSFSFDVPSEKGASPKVPDSRDSNEMNMNDDNDLDASDTTQSIPHRRFGVGIPSEDLDTYARNFLEYDDGKRIIEDPQGYRRDPEVQAKWEEERKVLTQDWKRKRKLAVSRRSHKQFHRYGGLQK